MWLSCCFALVRAMGDWHAKIDATGAGPTKPAAGAFAAGAKPEMLTSRLVPLDADEIRPPRNKKGGTLNTILTPEPPVLVLGVNNSGPDRRSPPASCTRACASLSF